MKSEESGTLNAPLYRVHDWEGYFEKGRATPKLMSFSWVATPNHHDSSGFRLLMRYAKAEGIEGAAAYGAWALMVQCASRARPRGYLIDHGRPLTASLLATRTEAEEKNFEAVIRIALRPDVGWLEEVTNPGEIIELSVAANEGKKRGRPSASSKAWDTWQALRAERGIDPELKTRPTEQAAGDLLKACDGDQEKVRECMQRYLASEDDWVLKNSYPVCALVKYPQRYLTDSMPEPRQFSDDEFKEIMQG